MDRSRHIGQVPARVLAGLLIGFLLLLFGYLYWNVFQLATWDHGLFSYSWVAIMLLIPIIPLGVGIAQRTYVAVATALVASIVAAFLVFVLGIWFGFNSTGGAGF